MNTRLNVRRELPTPLVHPLDDNRKLIALIGEVTKESAEAIRTQLWDEEHDQGKHHRENFERHGLTPHVWDERLEEYCRKLVVWLPSYVAWNRRPEKLKMRAWIGSYLARESSEGCRVLTVGDGAGFDSLYLAQCGHEVTYFELSERAVDFARRLFATSNRIVNVVTDASDLNPGSFDVVVCLDVLEHVPDPPNFVDQISGYLRPGGLLIVHAPFFFVTRHCPTHLKANRKYSGDLRRLYTPQQLRVVDGRFFWDPLVLEKSTIEQPRHMRRRLWTLTLRFAGLLLAVGRFWAFPHNLVAIRARRKVDHRWLRDLAPDAEQT